MSDHLAEILARKRREVERRKRHPLLRSLAGDGIDRGPAAIARLRRGDAAVPRIIAEFKRRSPSTGTIRARVVGDVATIVRGYEAVGVAAISVLADRPGFDGCVLDVRRAARATATPVLFKEFVIDPVQLPFARASGASLILLLVRALDQDALRVMIRAVRDHGMEPVVEAAGSVELARALETDALVVGVNSRDLRSFEIDPVAAGRALQEVPSDRVAVYMSGVSSREDLATIGQGRADAVLIGTALMRARDPGARLQEILS